jgi:hypothetical protein
MFLQEADVLSVTKRQYFFKLQANFGVFTSLILTQVFALAFSFMGSGSMGTGTELVSLTVNYYTGNVIIIFTMIWAFINGVTISSNNAKNGDFAFVTNRLTSNLSNIAFLLTVTILGGFTAMLASSLLKVILYYFFNTEGLIGNTNIVPPVLQLIGVFTSILYVSLSGALGYLVGVLVQKSKVYSFILPIFFVGMLFMEARMQGEGPFWQLLMYFGTETSLFLLLIKVFVFMCILFLTAVFISNRIEVRK